MAELQLKMQFTYGDSNKSSTKTIDIPLNSAANVQLQNVAKAYGSLVNNYNAVTYYKVVTTDIGIE